jgi:hypothetical protein
MNTNSFGREVYEELLRRGHNIHFDPESHTYKNWWKKSKVFFEDDKGTSNFDQFSGDIQIYKESQGADLTDPQDKLTYSSFALLHESGHSDIFPVEYPLMAAGLFALSTQFDDPIYRAACVFGGYYLYKYSIGELTVEAYNCLKYGIKEHFELLKDFNKIVTKPTKKR